MLLPLIALAALVALAAVLLPAGGASAAVLVVGDSLGVGTEGPLRAALGDVEVDADNLSGRTSTSGVEVLREAIGPQHDTVVFDLGTNDGPTAVSTTLASLAAARDIADGRCLVFATLNHPPVGGTDISAQNAALRRFALETPNAVLVDWNGATAAATGMLQPDGVHATAAGYAYRGALFADAIAGCVGGGGDQGADRGRSGPAPSLPASSTKRPATSVDAPTRPSRPSPAERLTGRVAARLTGEGGPLQLASRAGATVVAAAQVMGAALTPRGPEPVLGASSG